MWKVLEPLLKRASKSSVLLKSIQPNLRLELELFGKLKENYVRTLNLFNEFLLEYGTDKNLARLGELQALYSYNSVLDTGNDIFGVEFKLEKECQEALKAQVTDAQKQALTELLQTLESGDLKELKKNLFLQQRIVTANDFLLHLADFKHLLEQEGKLLEHELDVLTHIEDRLQTLLNEKDPFHEFDASTLVAILRQVLFSLGYHDLQISATGSTARGTAVKTSDYDILAYIPPPVYNSLVTNDKFGKYCNSAMPAYVKTIPGVKKIEFEDAFITQKPLGIKQLSGFIYFEDQSPNTKPPEIHFMVVDDLNDYVGNIGFSTSHAEWIRHASERQIVRMMVESKEFKDYLTGVFLYEPLKVVSGTMIEKLLRNIRLKRLCQTILARCIPWTGSSLRALKSLLIECGWNNDDWERFAGSDKVLWDKQHMRAKLLAVSAKRILQKEKPEFTIGDLRIFYPDKMLVEVEVIGKERLNDFINLTSEIFQIEAVYGFGEAGFGRVFYVMSGTPKTMRVHGLRLLAVQTLKTLPVNTIKQAILAPKQQLIVQRQNQFLNEIIDFYRKLM